MVRQSDWLNYHDLVAIVEEGDLIECDSGLFCHWAVYVGRQGTRHLVVHRVGQFSTDENNTGIRVSEFRDLFNNRKCRIYNYMDGRATVNNPQETVDRAMSRVHDKEYNLVFGNCEHFATWCRYSQENSDQVFVLKNIMKCIQGGSRNFPVFFWVAN
uniref:LRAT domain-containing protein n=1 Tax=Panagrolaimus sp. PS1159 TaxID=55785 RepID=A0AC35FY98_9BILA